MSARGFSLIELLVACAIVITLGGAVVAVIAPVGEAILRVHARADLDSSARAAFQQLLSDLRQAGNDASVAALDVRLARRRPRVEPLRDIDSNQVSQPAAAIRVSYTPLLAAQGLLAQAASAGDTLLRLDTARRCATGAPTCGFRPGQLALLYTASSHAVVVVETTVVGAVAVARPLVSSFPPGAILSEFVTVTYGTRPAADRSHRLIRITSGEAEQPILDNVVHFEVATDSNDLFATTRVVLTLRVQTPHAELRGPAGQLFRLGGTATHVRRWVPDLELRAVVALRGPAGTW